MAASIKKSRGVSQVGTVSDIIYTLSRNECECLAAALRHEGVGAQLFHAQLFRGAEEETMARWLRNDPDRAVIVATTAFSMSVGKLNVRIVVTQATASKHRAAKRTNLRRLRVSPMK